MYGDRATKKRLLVGGLVLAFALAALATAYYGFGKSNNENAKSTTAQTNTKEIDGILTAVLREWAVTEVCYDSQSKYIFFNVAPHEPIEGKTNEGWNAIGTYKFVELSNGTYIFESYGREFELAIDTTGLQCKTQLADPNWFK